MSRYKLNTSEAKEARRIVRSIRNDSITVNIVKKLRYQAREISNKALRNPTPNQELEALLGCSIPEYRAYIEQLFVEGMNWDNRGVGQGHWNIDHIRPLATFDLSDQEQFKKAVHYTNTRPLWSKTNNNRPIRHYHTTVPGEVNDFINTLKKEIEFLEQEVRILKRRNKLLADVAEKFIGKFEELKLKIG